MPQLVLSRGSSYRGNFLKKFFPNVELGPYFLVFSLILFVAVISVTTLVFSTRQVTKGYVLSSLENQHKSLLRENERRDMDMSVVRSLKHIEESGKVRTMVRPSKTVFVSGETSIAKN
ncbi:hypothetical protein HZC20_00420 [Candidatus Peregrinibacteria bacterium]|nr:hypothetical protein [Candidatus Peregrinibacteria bacterium]